MVYDFILSLRPWTVSIRRDTRFDGIVTIELKEGRDRDKGTVWHEEFENSDRSINKEGARG